MDKGNDSRREEVLRSYLDLTQEQVRQQLADILAREVPAPGHRQVPFNAVETLLCYGLFYLLDPHRYGGGNIDQAPALVHILARLFKRSPGSLTNKMLNLDGSRPHGKSLEPLLFAILAAEPERYRALYQMILTTARQLALDEETLPDFLADPALAPAQEELLGQEEVPASSSLLLAKAGAEAELQEVERAFRLGERLTEKLVERKIRLAQHRFALEVLRNCGRHCVFCGFEPRSLPEQSGLLRASHIKPWAVATPVERVDVRNGLAACPTHDAAFDQGYLTVNGGYRIHRARVLEQSVVKDQGASYYFGAVLSAHLLLPEQAKRPALRYLTYHREHIFKG
jgi:putative restriction endonuclease